MSRFFTVDQATALLPQIERHLRDALFARNEYQKAADEAEQARSAAEQNRAAVLQAECAAVAARAWKALNRPENAEVRHLEAIRLFSSQGARRRLEEFDRAWN